MSWWLDHTEADLSEDVPAPPEQVRAFYVDLDNIKVVHPLIVSVQTTSRTEGPDGYRHSYRVVDRIPLGPLTLKISYRARLHVPHEGDVLTEADQSPGVRLRGRVSFEPIDAGTRVTEQIRIAAPRPLSAMTAREGSKRTSRCWPVSGVTSSPSDVGEWRLGRDRPRLPMTRQVSG